MFNSTALNSASNDEENSKERSSGDGNVWMVVSLVVALVALIAVSCVSAVVFIIFR